MENKTVSVELTEEQLAFLTAWQKTHEKELGIEVPLGAMVRKAVDGAMKAQAKPEFSPRPERRDGDRPSFGDRPRPSFGGGRPSGGRDGGRPSFGDRPRPSFGGGRDGAKPSFGDRPRPSFGGGRPSGGRDGGRPSFGDRPRPSFGGGSDSRGPKFNSFSDKKTTTKKFDE